MSSIDLHQTMAADIKTLLAENQNIKTELAELKRALEARAAELSAEKPAKGKKPSAKAEAKKAAKAEAEAEGSAEPRAPSAWNLLVAQTVADMKQSGWESWTDLKGTVWPASRRGPIKTAGGSESEGFVYDGGEKTDGKAPSPALGGMVRASYLKAQTDPAALAKAQAYHAKLDEKRSAASASVGEGEKEAPVADAAAVQPKKAGRKPMTDEQKAEAAAKRAAKKAQETVAEPSAKEAEPSAEKPAKKTLLAPKPKKLDLSFYRWSFEGTDYLKNDRGDLILEEEGTWAGRFDGKKVDESIEEPSDLDGVTMRE
jgi:hypothetical protein